MCLKTLLPLESLPEKVIGYKEVYPVAPEKGTGRPRYSSLWRVFIKNSEGATVGSSISRGKTVGRSVTYTLGRSHRVRHRRTTLTDDGQEYLAGVHAWIEGRPFARLYECTSIIKVLMEEIVAFDGNVVVGLKCKILEEVEGNM